MPTKKKKTGEGYQMIIGVCKDNDVIVDITYDGILEHLTTGDLEDVYLRTVYLKKYIRSLLWDRWWESVKNYFRRK